MVFLKNFSYLCGKIKVYGRESRHTMDAEIEQL